MTRSGPRTGLIGGTAWLVRARWRIARNSLLRSARWRRITLSLVAAAIAFLALVALGFSFGLTRAVLALAEEDVATAMRTGETLRADVMPALVFSGSLGLAFMVSFTVALAALYLSADLDLLLSAPVPRRAVFGSKLIGGLMPTHLVVMLLTFVPLLGHGIAMGYGRTYWIAVLVALVLLPLLPTAIGALAVMVIVRRVSAHRLGEVVGLVVVAMTLSLAVVAGGTRELRDILTLAQILDVLDRFRSPVSPAAWLTNWVVMFARGQTAGALGWLGLFIGVAAAFWVPLFLLAENLYYEGWTRMQSADRRREATGGRLPWNRVDRAADLSRPSGWLRRLPQPTVAVLRKDFRVVPRDLTNMAQVLSPLAIGVFFVLQQLLYPIRVGGADAPQPFVAPLLAMLSAVLASGVSAMITARFGLTAFSSEGRGYWVLKSSPIGRDELLLGKFLVGYVPYLVIGFGLVVLMELARALSDALAAQVEVAPALLAALNPAHLFYAWFVVAVLGVGILSLTLALGASRPNLRWDTPHEMLTPDVGCLSLMLYGAYLAVAMPALTMPAAVSGFDIIGHNLTLWLAGLTVGLGSTATIAYAAWRLALLEVGDIGE